jgi:hypothetical protein
MDEWSVNLLHGEQLRADLQIGKVTLHVSLLIVACR